MWPCHRGGGGEEKEEVKKKKKKTKKEKKEEEEEGEKGEEEEVYMSALTKEANIPSSCSRSVSGLSYSRMFPLFITMTRSAVRMV